MWKLFWGDDFDRILPSNRKNVVPGASSDSGGKDVLIVDTAGRLHTSGSMMDEMKKIDRVIGIDFSPSSVDAAGWVGIAAGRRA